MGGAGGGARWDCGNKIREPALTCTDDAPPMVGPRSGAIADEVPTPARWRPRRRRAQAANPHWCWAQTGVIFWGVLRKVRPAHFPGHDHI